MTGKKLRSVIPILTTTKKDGQTEKQLVFLDSSEKKVAWQTVTVKSRDTGVSKKTQRCACL